jgi:hypothetical protein
MKHHGVSFLFKFLRNQRGQSSVFMAMSILVTGILGGAAIESGHVYYSYERLVASTNAAAVAAGQAMPAIGTSSSPAAGTAYYNIYKYSSDTASTPSGLNANTLLSGASISMSFACSSSVSSNLNVGCEAPTSGSCGSGISTCNVLKATQTASVNLWFGGLLGMPTMHLTAVSYAAMRGGSDTPYNIAVIIDTTESMTASAPSGDGCGSGASQISCAVAGLKAMLEDMDPCPLNQTCPGNASYVDGVALFTFPAISVATETKSGNTVETGPYDDTTCPTTNPPIVPYAFVNVASSSQNLALPSATSGTNYSANYAGTYQVAAFEDSYRANDGSTTLDSGDSLSSAVGYETSGTCKGLQAPGGEGTYYAQIIYAAQSALVTQQGLYPGSKNIMIILSDGDATACNTQAYAADGGMNGCNNGDQIVAVNCPGVSMVGGTPTCGSASVSISGNATTLSCPPGGCTSTPLNGTGTSTTNSTGYNVTTYPSALGECGQAVQAAQAATKAGTTVYTIAMGSETSGGCASDQTVTVSSSATYGAEAFPSGTYSGQPCNAIAAMASTENTFYSDNTGGCAALVNTSTQFETIAGIFQAIANSLTNARLIPASAF